ncbi:DUF748 domain-containing protein, partial [bacterium]|nr:DUF748 domain-containing protein [bacterium]
GGVSEFEDRLLNEKHIVSDINLSLPFVSSMAYATESFVEPLFSAHINGAPLVIKGRSKPFANSLESEMALDLGHLELAKYLDYIPFKLPVKVLSGALDTNLKLVFRQEKGKPSTLLLSGAAAIKNVNAASGAPLLSFKHLDLELGSADLLGRKFVIDRFTVDSPEVHARVSAQGTINWNDLFSKELATAGRSPPEAAGKPEPAAPVE